MTPDEEIAALHRRIDARADSLAEHHGRRLKCARGCSGCCVDELTVFRVEADHIRRHARELLRTGRPGPRGACAFLDEAGACRIYPWRPYVCRTQGLPLRWLADEDDGLVEYRDICPLNEEGEPLEALDEAVCWTIGAVEGELAGLEQRAHGGLERVALRDLFTGGSVDHPSN